MSERKYSTGVWHYPTFTLSSGLPAMRSCNCIGPQNGEPLCPCAMQGVRVRDGRYIKETDLGPAPSDASEGEK